MDGAQVSVSPLQSAIDVAAKAEHRCVERAWTTADRVGIDPGLRRCPEQILVVVASTPPGEEWQHNPAVCG